MTTAIRCENCNGVAWRLGTAPIAKDKDGYTLQRTCRQCGAAGPDHVVTYAQHGGRNWASDPKEKNPPQPVALMAPKKETNPVADSERAKAPTVQTATQILKERLGLLTKQVVDVTTAQAEAEQIHKALTALGEQPDPLPWKAKKP